MCCYLICMEIEESKWVENAIYNLGIMYRNGRGVKQGDREAVKWYRKSCRARSCFCKKCAQKIERRRVAYTKIEQRY